MVRFIYSVIMYFREVREGRGGVTVATQGEGANNVESFISENSLWAVFRYWGLSVGGRIQGAYCIGYRVYTL